MAHVRPHDHHSPAMPAATGPLHAGHDHHAGHSPEMFRDKFWWSLVLTLPVVYWSDHVQMLLGYRAVDFPGADWIAPFLATVVFYCGGLVFPSSRSHWRPGRSRPGTFC